RVVARRKVPVRQLVQLDERLAREIEHQIETLAPLGVGAREVDGADRAAGGDALAVRLAARHVDLVVVADRALGTGAHAGVAARAKLEIDRVLLPPRHIEGADPARELGDAAGPHGVLALERQRAAAAPGEAAAADLRARSL